MPRSHAERGNEHEKRSVGTSGLHEEEIDDGTLVLRERKPYDIRTPDALKAGYR